MRFYDGLNFKKIKICMEINKQADPPSSQFERFTQLMAVVSREISGQQTETC